MPIANISNRVVVLWQFPLSTQSSEFMFRGFSHKRRLFIFPGCKFSCIMLHVGLQYRVDTDVLQVVRLEL